MGERVRVLRLLEFEGPRKWVDTTLEKSWLHPSRGKASFMGPENHARELMRVELPVTQPDLHPYVVGPQLLDLAETVGMRDEVMDFLTRLAEKERRRLREAAITGELAQAQRVGEEVL